MTDMTQADVESVIELSDKLSDVAEGYKNHIAMQATMNVLAWSIVNSCDTREKAETASKHAAAAIARAVLAYWSADRPRTR